MQTVTDKKMQYAGVIEFFFNNKNLCNELLLRCCTQTLVSLRRVDHSYKKYIDDWIANRIKASYKHQSITCFPDFDKEAQVFESSTLMFYLHAQHYSNKEENKAYVKFYESLISDWIRKCRNCNFQYELGKNNSCIKIYEKMYNKVIYKNVSQECKTFNSTKPIEAYFLSKFLEEYVEEEELLRCFDINKSQVLDLLMLFKSYRDYDGVKTIILRLVYIIKKRMQSSNLDLQFASLGAMLFSELLENDILTSQDVQTYLNGFVLFALECNRSSLATLRLVTNLIIKDVFITDDHVLLIKEFAMKYITQNSELAVKAHAFKLLLKLIEKGKISASEELANLSIECIQKNNNKIPVKDLAFNFFENLLYHGIRIKEINCQLLLQLIFQNLTDLQCLDLYGRLLNVLCCLKNKKVEIPTWDCEKLLNLVMQYLKHPQCQNLYGQLINTLCCFINNGMSILIYRHELLDLIQKHLNTNGNHFNYSLYLFGYLIDKKIAIAGDHFDSGHLIALIEKHKDHSQWQVRVNVLFILSQLVEKETLWNFVSIASLQSLYIDLQDLSKNNIEIEYFSWLSNIMSLFKDHPNDEIIKIVDNILILQSEFMYNSNIEEQ